MDEAGLFVIWKQRHWPVDLCKIEWEEKLSSAQVLTLLDFRGLFIIFAVGLTTAVLVFTIEVGIIPCLINLYSRFQVAIDMGILRRLKKNQH